MQIVTFDTDQVVSRYDSRGARWTRVARSDGECHVGRIRLEPGGTLGMHPTGVDQVFLVVAGEGWTRVEGEERIPIVAGQAAVWCTGERHESGTDTGMTVIVIQAETLTIDPGA